MIADFAKQAARDILASYPGADAARQKEIIAAFWDLQYMARFGAPEIKLTPNPDGPFPPWPIPFPWPRPFPRPWPLPFPWPLPWPQPGPDPLPYDRGFAEDLVLEMIDVNLGDPSPQPSLMTALKDIKPRRAAAKAALARHLDAAKQLERAIEKMG
ncbi:hypothetical protein [Jannaschia pohangensis]|uniref:Uncharacterized protein n=1 Tax=Jannaschia pohangensis TaxID=390807 RepID=A0A1I3IYU6_9RHOB|nr:hypothetical protein [Jannaschia pohangensis]SFI53070.1 hypothetical protein SAMN04488095_1147 [Jannaschia pohangensis]